MPYENLDDGLKTVGDWLEHLKQFPADWPVVVRFAGNGGTRAEHREARGKPLVAVFNANGGSFGNLPLTEERYKAESAYFLKCMKNPAYRYTTEFGDHRMILMQYGVQAGSFGKVYDHRIIKRMVEEGAIPAHSVDLERVEGFEKIKPITQL